MISKGSDILDNYHRCHKICLIYLKIFEKIHQYIRSSNTFVLGNIIVYSAYRVAK